MLFSLLSCTISYLFKTLLWLWSLIKKVHLCFAKVSSEIVSHLVGLQFFATSWTVTCQTPLSMKFSRQDYWNGLPYQPPGYLPNPGIESGSPPLQADYLLSEPPWKPTSVQLIGIISIILKLKIPTDAHKMFTFIYLKAFVTCNFNLLLLFF